ncbi:unnamed protein product [Schistosoma curassoni]|uniref:Apple domain-containing protein n=1 Tax=Schistosoma curassoni TaxID=6186 RepID=A0A183JN66_9TREM|nr:unnamed protein product [Schistosoma curassoni]
MPCNYSKWIGGWGLPNQSFINNYTLSMVQTSSSCLNECLSNPLCYSYTSPTDLPTQCTLYSKPINLTGELYNRTAFEFGTRICCTDVKNIGVPMSPCLPCSTCTKLMQCNQTYYLVKPGLPNYQFLSTYFLRQVNATINCAGECELNPYCLSFSYIVVSSVYSAHRFNNNNNNNNNNNTQSFIDIYVINGAYIQETLQINVTIRYRNPLNSFDPIESRTVIELDA